MQRTAFKNLTIGQSFAFNQTAWIKNSTRTARLEENGRIFYFGQNEQVLYKLQSARLEYALTGIE